MTVSSNREAARQEFFDGLANDRSWWQNLRSDLGAFVRGIVHNDATTRAGQLGTRTKTAVKWGGLGVGCVSVLGSFGLVGAGLWAENVGTGAGPVIQANTVNLDVTGVAGLTEAGVKYLSGMMFAGGAASTLAVASMEETDRAQEQVSKLAHEGAENPRLAILSADHEHGEIHELDMTTGQERQLVEQPAPTGTMADLVTETQKTPETEPR